MGMRMIKLLSRKMLWEEMKPSAWHVGPRTAKPLALGTVAL